MFSELYNIDKLYFFIRCYCQLFTDESKNGLIQIQAKLKIK